MFRSLVLASLLFALPVAAEPFTLTAEDWVLPRSGATLTQLPPLTGAVQAFEREADGVIVIAHATGEAGQLWAEELRSWLVALGISSAHIRFDARPELQNVLVLDIRKRDSL